MVRLRLVLAAFVAISAILSVSAVPYDIDETALLAELEGRNAPAKTHSLMSFDDLSPESLALLEADAKESTQAAELLQISKAAPVPKKDPAARNGPEDIHIQVAKTAHSAAKASETLSGIEAKFNHGHDKVMRGLNKALGKITKHVDQNKNADILLETGGIVRPKIDGTGSIPQGAPRANLTRFTVKPVIDASLTLDAKLIKKATAFVEIAGEGEGDAESDAETASSVDVDAEVEAAIADTDSVETETESESESESESAVNVESEVESAIDATNEEQAPQSLMEVSSQSTMTATAGIDNPTELGNYPGWQAMIEEQAQAAPAPAPAAKNDEPSFKPVQPAPPVRMILPKSSRNVKHVTLGELQKSAVLRHAKTGIKKIHVHVYGKADEDVDKERRLQGMVRRLATKQSESYKKINALLKKLKSCANDDKDCLKNYTEKLEDWKAEFTN